MLDPNLINIDQFLLSFKDLVKSSLSANSKIGVDAIICITPDESNEIVLKLHEILNNKYLLKETSEDGCMTEENQFITDRSSKYFVHENSKKSVNDFEHDILENDLNEVELLNKISIDSPLNAIENSSMITNIKMDMEEFNEISIKQESKACDSNNFCLIRNSIISDEENIGFTPISIIPDNDTFEIKEEELDEDCFADTFLEDCHRIFSCNLCSNVSFGKFGDLYEHNLIEHKKYSCSVCQNVFTFLSNLRRHESLHTGIKNWSCYICYKRFHRKSDMQLHVMRHSNKSSKSSKWTNVFHRNSRNKSKMFASSIVPLDVAACSETVIISEDHHEISSPDHILNHDDDGTVQQMDAMNKLKEERLWDYENEEIDEKKHFFCADCPSELSCFEELSYHSEFKHNRYVCHICLKSFSNRNGRLRHVNAHTKSKTFSCETCCKQFYRSDSLKEHLIVHSQGYANGVCDHCGISISKKALLYSHMRGCPSQMKAKFLQG